MVILETRVDVSGHGAGMIERNSDDILFALDDGFGECSLRS